MCYTDRASLFDDPVLWPVLQKVTSEDFNPENEEFLRRLASSRSIEKTCFAFIEFTIPPEFEPLSWLRKLCLFD